MGRALPEYQRPPCSLALFVREDEVQRSLSSRGVKLSIRLIQTHTAVTYTRTRAKNNQRLTQAVFLLCTHLAGLKAVRPNTCGNTLHLSVVSVEKWRNLLVEAIAVSVNPAQACYLHCFPSFVSLSLLSKQTNQTDCCPHSCREGK